MCKSPSYQSTRMIIHWWHRLRLSSYSLPCALPCPCSPLVIHGAATWSVGPLIRAICLPYSWGDQENAGGDLCDRHVFVGCVFLFEMIVGFLCDRHFVRCCGRWWNVTMYTHLFFRAEARRASALWNSIFIIMYMCFVSNTPWPYATWITIFSKDFRISSGWCSMEHEQRDPIQSIAVLIYCSQKDAIHWFVPFPSIPFSVPVPTLLGDWDVLRLTLLEWLRLLAYFDADFSIVDDERSGIAAMWLWCLRMWKQQVVWILVEIFSLRFAFLLWYRHRNYYSSLRNPH